MEEKERDSFELLDTPTSGQSKWSKKYLRALCLESRGRDARWIFVKAAVVGHIIEQESEMLSETVTSVAEFLSQ